MRRRVWQIVGVSLVALVLVVGGMSLRDRAAHDELAEARALLSASLRDVPELHELEATHALVLIEHAESLGASEPGLRHYARAVEDLGRGDLIFAEGNLSTARHHLGWTADLRVLAGTIARLRKDTDTARGHVADALSRGEDHARAHLLNADLAIDRGDVTVARRSLRTLVELAPRAAVVRNRFGLAEELARDDEAAERRFRQAIELDEHAHNAHINLGRALHRRGELEEAEASFSRAIALNIGDGEAHFGRGLVRMELDPENATVDLERAAELMPDLAAPRLALGDLAAREDIARAIAIYREALAVEDDGGEAAYVKLGNALLRNGDVRDAVLAFREAIRRRPQSGAAHNGLGAALMRAGGSDVEAARVALERAAELDRDDPHPLMNLGLLHERVGDAESARSAWERVLERDPDSYIAQEHLL